MSISLDGNIIDDCTKNDDSASVLQLALLRVLRVANGFHGLDDEDFSNKDGVDPEIWAPASLFRALRAHRWVINTDEQDAHEFFQVLKTTILRQIWLMVCLTAFSTLLANHFFSGSTIHSGRRIVKKAKSWSNISLRHYRNRNSFVNQHTDRDRRP